MRHKAFTLLELSIVLVIIGLIAGGVLVGRDLIYGSQIRAQVTQFEKFNQAETLFEEKYSCIPGDCANFTSFFPSFAPGQTFGVGNGNGNGILNDSGNSIYPNSVYNESVLFWMQLYTAGVTECCNPAGSNFFVITMGTTFPKDKVNGFSISADAMQSRHGYFWGMTTSVNNVAYLNMYLTLSDNSLGKAVLTPKQAQAYDRKVDDGMPTAGNVYAASVYGGDNTVRPIGSLFLTNCITNTTPYAYDTSRTTNVCNLWINW